jgi:hypothetical protein
VASQRVDLPELILGQRESVREAVLYRVARMRFGIACADTAEAVVARVAARDAITQPAVPIFLPTEQRPKACDELGCAGVNGANRSLALNALEHVGTEASSGTAPGVSALVVTRADVAPGPRAVLAFVSGRAIQRFTARSTMQATREQVGPGLVVSLPDCGWPSPLGCARAGAR